MTAQKHSPFGHMTKNRLRLWLLLFFIALAIPAGLLIHQAYEELQWEAFHQHRVQAEELSNRIDTQLLALINKEEKRGFSDYAFLNITGTAENNFLQRSPLADFPLTSDIPGLLGYFQVDTDGRFSTPLLPDDLNIERYGITANEYRLRQNLQRKLLHILDKNQLVKRNPEKRTRTANKNATPIPVEADETSFVGVASRLPSSSLEQEGKLAAINAPMPNVISANAEISGFSLDEASVITTPVVSQQAFDQLKTAPARSPMANNKGSRKFGRVADLKLDDAYQARADKNNTQKQQLLEQRQKKEALQKKKIRMVKKARSEISRLPAAKASALLAPKDASTFNNQARIRTFESEVDAFELSLLDSGHFVLYRKIWRNGQRIIQGLLIEQQPFIAGTIQNAFSSTALSAMSHLRVAWRGDVISRFQASAYRGYTAQQSDFKRYIALSDCAVTSRARYAINIQHQPPARWPRRQCH